MNLVAAKVVTKHALLVGGFAAAAVVARDLFILAFLEDATEN